MSMTNYKVEAIKELAADIVKAGFRAFIAERGTYGFYTDAEGTRVVGFQYELGGISFSGNYKTDQPCSTGSGWGFGIPSDYDSVAYKSMFQSGPPGWAVGSANWKLTTLVQHLATYQASSKYTEFTVEGA